MTQSKSAKSANGLLIPAYLDTITASQHSRLPLNHCLGFVWHFACQLNHAESDLLLREREKSVAYWNVHPFAKKLPDPMPATWKTGAKTLRKLKISRTSWTCACAFSSLCPALMLDYTPSVPPLPPLKYGSDDRKRPAASMGAAAHGEVDESRGKGWGVAEGGGVSCVTLSHPWRLRVQRVSQEMWRMDGVKGGGAAGNSLQFSPKKSCHASISSGARIAPYLAPHWTWSPREASGLMTRTQCRLKEEWKARLGCENRVAWLWRFQERKKDIELKIGF